MDRGGDRVIEVGNFQMENNIYNRKICSSDWRYSASIVGLLRYFDYHKIKYNYDERHLYYNFEDIDENTEEKYLEYVEHRYRDRMHHVVVENLLLKKELDKDEEKLIKDKLGATVTLKKLFKDISLEDKNLIQSIIDENRYMIIRETFKNAKTGYSKFSNPNRFRNTSDDVCRLNGYCIDTGRKTKSLSFGFDDRTRSYSDELEFDFIPFAFSDDREAIFINNNFTIEHLFNSNTYDFEKLTEEEKNNFRNRLFFTVSKGAKFIDYDVEIIIKEMDKDYFDTLFVRREAIEIFKKIGELEAGKDNIKKSLKSVVKVSEDYYIRIMDEVTDCILNLVVLDGLINLLLKRETYGFVISQLIKINRLIYEKKYLKEGQMVYLGGYKSVKESVDKVKAYMIKKNVPKKIESYRYRLISALVANDKDRFQNVMLQLSAYTETHFDFMHDLYVDFDKNKNLAYDFVNSINFYNKNENEEENNEK